jgi:Zn-dependent oligopeptidase
MATTEEDLNQLEKDIRQFKIEFEQYFGGGRARPPSDTEWRIEQTMKRYGDRGAHLNFAQRFRFNNLIQTYAKYREIFRKRLKQKEEGYVQKHFGAAAKAIEAERAAASTAQQAASDEPAVAFAMACADPDQETSKVEQLYQAFLTAKQSAGESTDSVTLDRFREFLREKTNDLKKQKGCQQVEYLVAVEDGQVRLKARVKE